MNVSWLLVLVLVLVAAQAIQPAKAGQPEGRSGTREEFRIEVPFFDGIKLQTTNIHPRLTNANHMIRDINRVTGSSLRDWDTMVIQSLDVLLWHDLSPHLKVDVAVGGATGSLLSSSTAFRGSPVATAIRMRQRYSALEVWTNLYYFPLTTDCVRSGYRSGRLLEPFLAAGAGYTWFRSESVFKMRMQRTLYNRARCNWNAGAWAWKIYAGCNFNLRAVSKKLDGWVLTVAAWQVWNRLQGHATLHLTDGLRVGGHRVNVDVQRRRDMDIDLSGQYYSFAVGWYF